MKKKMNEREREEWREGGGERERGGGRGINALLSDFFKDYA